MKNVRTKKRQLPRWSQILFQKHVPIEISYNGVGIGQADTNPTYVGLLDRLRRFF
jgi:hypothetical protein